MSALLRKIILFTCFSLILPFHASAMNSKAHITDLRVEYLEDPLAIDVAEPRLQWRIQSSERGAAQTAYRILAASTESNLKKNIGDLWDSGKVTSNKTQHIVYQGKPLPSRTSVYWKVMIWDQEGRKSSWSRTASWRMGLLNFNDWSAKWIGFDVGHAKGDRYKELFLPPAAYFRKPFEAKKKIKNATLYATAQGIYEFQINGKRVGDEYFSPGWTDYNKRLYYRAYDVKKYLNEGGENAIGAVLADGWYSGYVGYGLYVKLEKVRAYYGERPGLFAQLELEYENGEREVIPTDYSWLANQGPIREADILMGETYDARRELDGWSSAAYEPADGEWKNARWRAPGEGELKAYPGVPVKIQEEIEPVSIERRDDGKYIFDFGKNFAGVVRLNVSGNRGNVITLRYAEMLHLDGSIMTENLRKARATDTYTLKGDGVETWQPRFTYHGFQYVEVSGLSYKPDENTLTGLRMNSDTREVGDIRIEKDVEFGGNRGMVSQLFENIKTTQYANFFEVPTDCPQRDERLGWTGDAQIYASASSYVADVSAFFNKWLQDLDDSQTWYGAYPNFAPQPYTRKDEYSPAWMDAGVIVPYAMYQAYADTEVISRAWDGMTKFMEFQRQAAGDDYLRPGAGNNYGDWLSAGPETSDDFIASAYYGYDAKLMSEMAEAIGKSKQADDYRSLFQNIRSEFAKKYIDPEGKITDDTQTAYVIALSFDLYPEELREMGARRLAQLVEENDGKLTTGFLGVKHLLPVLTEFGYSDLAYDLLTETEYPSWGFEVVNGATSIWERWNSFTKSKGFVKGMNSFSHYSYGAVVEWMFRSMGGINAAKPGFSEILIKPVVGKPFSGVETRFESHHGLISTHWRKNGPGLSLLVTIPANTTATVQIPAVEGAEVFEGGRLAAQADGVQFVSHDGEYAIYQVKAGSYHFESAQR